MRKLLFAHALMRLLCSLLAPLGLNPLSLNINMHLLHTVLHIFLMVLLERIFVLTYNISSLVIISVILMTYLFDQQMLMLGEIGKLSLKELKETETTAVQATVDTA